MCKSEFLENYLRRVFEDFSNSNWCNLNNFKLNKDAYKSTIIQQMYILKYFAAYFCEYYRAYLKLLKEIDQNKEEELNIISIGCGCGVDFYALEYAIAKSNLSLPVSYLGIDAIDWAYKPNSKIFKFSNKLITEIQVSDIADKNIIVFPKSLTELSRSDLLCFSNLIATSNTKNNIYFLNSYITDNPADGNRVDGTGNFNIIASKLLSSGYKTEDNTYGYYYLNQFTSGLKSTFDFFNFPNDIINKTRRLKQDCEQKELNNHEAPTTLDCESCNIDFSPILNGKYMAYNTFKFTRT